MAYTQLHRGKCNYLALIYKSIFKLMKKYTPIFFVNFLFISFVLFSCEKDTKSESKLIRIIYNSDGSYYSNDTVDFNDNIAEIAVCRTGSTWVSYSTQLTSSQKRNLAIETLKPIQKGDYTAKSSTTSISDIPILSSTQVYINLFSPGLYSQSSNYNIATNGTLNITRAEMGKNMYDTDLFYITGTWEGTVLVNNLTVKKNAVLKLINVGFVK
jgi:hypothetical protein